MHPLSLSIELFNAFTSMHNLCNSESQAVYDFNTFVTSLYKCLLTCYISGMSKEYHSKTKPGLFCLVYQDWWGGSILGISPRNPHKSKTFDTTEVLVSGLFRSSFSKWGCLDFVVRLGFSHCDQTGSNSHSQIHIIFLPLPLKLVLDSGYQLVSHVFSI